MILTVDVETTGLTPGTDAVVELAGVTVPEGRAFATLVAPGRRIPPEAMAVHHIRDEDVREGPHLPLAVQQMLAFLMLDVFYVAAHNAPFDMGFIGQYLLPCRGVICTWKCAQHLFPNVSSYSNQGLRYHLGLDLEIREILGSQSLLMAPHRALYDAIVTAALLRKMLVTKGVEELVHLSTQPVLQRVCRFGAKHRGQLWADVPKSYLRWMLTLADLDADTKHTAEHWST